MEHQEESNRRPLAVRNIPVAKRIAVWLSQKNITPNQISLMSIAFAAMGFAFATGEHFWPTPIWLILFATAIQMRLLCNLFDGMVAVEGGKKTPAGELFNDVPDRVADPLLIVGAGFVTGSELGLSFAWVAASLAILSAYIRVLGVSMGCPADFRGPMAKQHRMALLTITLVVMAFSQWFEWLPNLSLYLMDGALVLMVLGCVLTCWRRLVFIFNTKAQQEQESQIAPASPSAPTRESIVSEHNHD